VAWRKAGAGSAGPAVAELEAYAAEYERAGDWERLAAVRSSLSMLAAAGGDGEIADLFAEFARVDRAARGGLA
jgi:glutamine synthetase adenylyltransferase